jgi:phosphoesterase RecJ-like protein
VTAPIDAAYDAAAEAIRAAGRVAVVTHENPDGDALGSLIGCVRGLRLAGLDASAHASDEPFPREFGWLDEGDVSRSVPEGAGWLLLAVDCGSAARIAAPEGLVAGAGQVVNVDHHHDNTRFGTIDVVDASAACAAMMVHTLLTRLGGPIPVPVALPLYVGLVTDTGRFQYSNTDPRALRFAADLVALGVEPQLVFSRVYEDVPAAKLRLLGRALSRIELRLDGRLALSWVTRADIAEEGADDAGTEGIIDHLRSIAGVEVAALVREPVSGPRYKASLRASTDAIDVSRIARDAGGGGHPRAAGFSSDRELADVLAFIERGVAAAHGRS